MVFSRIPLHLFLSCFISLDLQLIVIDFECQMLPKSIQHRTKNWMHIELVCCLEFVMFVCKILCEQLTFQHIEICQNTVVLQ